MFKKIFSSGLISFCVFLNVFSAEDYSKQLFTDFSSNSKLEGTAGKFVSPQNLTIEKTASGGSAMIVCRGAYIPIVALESKLKADEDYGYSFDITRLDNNSAMCCGFENATHKASAMIYYATDGVLKIRKPGNLVVYDTTGMVLKPKKKYHITVAVNAVAKLVNISVDGVGSYQAPIEFLPDLDRFVFSAQKPDGNQNLIENFRLYRKPGRIINRENGVKGNEVVSETNKAYLKLLQKAVDGATNETFEVPEKTTFEIVLPKRIIATAVQIYGGKVEYRFTPSGACAPRSYIVEGLSNGSWVNLVTEDNASDVCKEDGLSAEERVLRHDIKPIPIDRVRIKFLRSYDTGNRIAGQVAEENRAMHLREVEILTDKVVAQQVQLPSLIAMDFRLPVYRNADKAELTLIAAKSKLTPLDGSLTITAPTGEVIRTQKLSWNHGKNKIMIDNLQNLAAGRYKVALETEAGKLVRLLRLEKISEIQPPSVTPVMDGKKMYFTPDKYVLAEIDNLKVGVSKTELIEQVRTPSPDKLILYGTHFYQAEDGRYIVGVEDYDYKGNLFAKRTPRYMAADSLYGPFYKIDKLPPVKAKFSPKKNFQSGSFPKPPAGTKFEFYEPDKHGKIALGNLSYIYFYKKTDLGCMTALPRHYYVTGKTDNGQYVLMRREPLFRDVGYYGENDFDDGFMTNDNFGGMWISPDGKECFWAQGQTVKRSAPYALEFDNLQTGMRLITIYSTVDGVNWKLRNTMTAPDELDSEGAQHYGVSIMPLADGDLYLGSLFSYDGTTQQIYIDLIYSRDGIDFHRFKDRRAFVRSYDPKDWYFGHIFTNNNFVKEGKYYYQQASYCTHIAHFAFEVVFFVPQIADITAEMFRKRFEQRDLANKWPFFAQVGGYNGLAELARNSYYVAGAVKFRADGWFGLEAEAQEGSFKTQKFKAAGALTANAEIASDGYIDLQLCTIDGKVLQEKRLSGDDLNLAVFDKLPDSEFYIQGKMKNAILYTLNFSK